MAMRIVQGMRQRWGSSSCCSLRKLAIPGMMCRGHLQHQSMTVSSHLMQQAARSTDSTRFALAVQLPMKSRIQCYDRKVPMQHCTGKIEDSDRRLALSC